MAGAFQPSTCPELLKHSFSVLVADDDPDVLDTVSEALAACPLLVVHRAADPDEARATLRRGGGADVCVLDICFPDAATGLELIREFADRATILAMTGLATGGEGGQAVQLGAREVIDKPVKIAELLPRALAEALRAWLLHLAGIDPFLRQAVEVLCERRPGSVTRWAAQLGKDLSLLRRWWREAGKQGKFVLFVDRLYRTAFECYLGHECPGRGARAQRRLRRLTQYAQTHRAALAQYLPPRKTDGDLPQGQPVNGK
jgi:CheY-like chemotaxis protein